MPRIPVASTAAVAFRRIRDQRGASRVDHRFDVCARTHTRRRSRVVLLAWQYAVRLYMSKSFGVW